MKLTNDSPEEAQWRQLAREHAVFMRILREERDRENPLSRWDRWGPIVAMVCVVLAGLFIGWVVSLPMRPTEIHMTQERAP